MLSHTPVHQLSRKQRILHLSLWYALIATLVLFSVIAVHYQLYVSSESARQAEQHGYFDQVDTRSLSIMARDFALFSDEKIIYDQIRLIDRKGQEIIRINNQNGHSTIVDKSELQLKANRYYFKESMRIQRNEIYISPFDLNIEHG